MQDDLVENLQPGIVKVYDYYEIGTRRICSSRIHLAVQCSYTQSSHCICGLFCVRMHELENDFWLFSPSVGDLAVIDYPSPCLVQWEFDHELREHSRFFCLFYSYQQISSKLKQLMNNKYSMLVFVLSDFLSFLCLFLSSILYWNSLRDVMPLLKTIFMII